MWYVLAVIVVVTFAVAAAVLIKRRPGHGAAGASAAAVVAAPPADVPMTGLESALAQVTDRQGRPIRDHIDAETEHVDDLRVPDDTGPLLRRALDHVEHHDDPNNQEAPN